MHHGGEAGESQSVMGPVPQARETDFALLAGGSVCYFSTHVDSSLSLPILA